MEALKIMPSSEKRAKTQTRHYRKNPSVPRNRHENLINYKGWRW